VFTPDELAALDMPCLVMTGKRDRVISTAGVSSRAGRIPHARFRSFEDEGHLFLESSCEVTNAEILALLARA
jgi:pimeloyl-ACP methyl ester carboxylesterase